MESAVQIFAAVSFLVIGISHLVQRSAWMELFAAPRRGCCPEPVARRSRVELRIVVAGLLGAASAALAGSGPHWGYAGPEGPDHWGELAPEYSACSLGKNQSPIDLTGFVDSALAPIELRYRVGGHEVHNSGHGVEVSYAPGSSITVDGRGFELAQFHFHAPSEHLVDRRAYPMEAHLVHADADGNLAVVAVLFVAGEANAALAGIWSQLPAEVGAKRSLPAHVAAEALLPADRDYYRYNGSLTTPPCSEGVRWLVLKEPVPASRAQIETFARLLPHPNNRPVQPLHARPVLE